MNEGAALGTKNRSAYPERQRLHARSLAGYEPPGEPHWCKGRSLRDCRHRPSPAICRILGMGVAMDDDF